MDIELYKSRFGIICKKTEKLTTAVYMVTDFFPVTDPLRKRLRFRTLTLLSFIYTLQRGREEARQKVQQDVFFHIAEIHSLLDLALQMNFVSHMNFSILQEEYHALGEGVRVYFETHHKPYDCLLPERFFTTEEESRIGHKSSDAQEPKNTLKDTKRHSTKGHNMRTAYKHGVSDTYQSKKNPSKFKEKNERRATIERLLHTRGQLSIKDISNAIPGCSEKTVQRELLSLIHERRIVRKGERRWSVYMINSQQPTTNN